MPRKPRIAPGGLTYHVMNRRTARLRLFDDDGDCAAFLRVLAEARARQAMRVCAFVLMPDHWHLVLRPRTDGDLSAFMKWLAMTHTQRWHAHRLSAGHGHLYQSRFESFPTQQDGHFLDVCRYVERNPLRANLAARSADWPWGSLAARASGGAGGVAAADLLDEWPVPRRADREQWVDEPGGEAELEALRQCGKRGRPWGDAAWAAEAAGRLGLLSSLRPRGRPPLPRPPDVAAT